MRRRASIVLGLAWAGCVTGGMAALWRYGMTPAAAAAAPVTWPASAREAASDKPTLLVFLHPKCPCSRTTVSELADILARRKDQPRVRVAMLRPGAMEPGWEQTSLWRNAAALPGAELKPDLDGTLAKQFGAVTSGQILLYAPSGQLVFNGGITAGRGHAGDNAGRRALVAALESISASSRPLADTPSPVFGCELFNAGQ